MIIHMQIMLTGKLTRNVEPFARHPIFIAGSFFLLCLYSDGI